MCGFSLLRPWRGRVGLGGPGSLTRVVLPRGSDHAVCYRDLQELLHVLPQHQDLP